MTDITIKVASRQSPMAWFQAELIKSRLQQKHSNIHFELLGFTTRGDANTQQSLADIGGKDLFVKELQQALLDHKADIAVHCVKDMSVYNHPELDLAVICKRDDPRDVLVSNHFESLDQMPQGTVVGTASPRRAALVSHYYPQLSTKLIRGNVNTRLKKLQQGEYDAIILAAAGLVRLQKQHLIKQYLDVKRFVPAIGQGALAIECRKNDQKTLSIIQYLLDVQTNACVRAERAVNQVLGGNCDAPIGAYAVIKNQQLRLTAMVASMDGARVIKESITGDPHDYQSLGEQLASQLIAQGAQELWSKPSQEQE